MQFGSYAANYIRLVQEFEGLHRIGKDGLIYPYLCPAGYPTQGWGIVVQSMDVPPITREEADVKLLQVLPGYSMDAIRLSPILAKHPTKLAAVSSFVFNLGAGRYAASTMRRLINEGAWQAAADEFDKWVYGGGRKLSGLVRRRAAEKAVFMVEE